MKKYVYLITLIVLFSSCEKDYSDISMEGYPQSEVSGESYEDYGENPFLSTAEHPISTFSVDADGASYANMRRFLNQGQNPPTASVRIEEYINYFPFDYEEPTGEETVALNSEIATCPWNDAHHLIRVGMKGKTIPQNELPGSNFVFLIDVSGSMNSSDKLDILKAGFKTMVDNLSEKDKVAIVTYAGSAGVLLYSTSGDQKETIKSAINSLGAGGSTAGADGIITAYEIAEEAFISNGNNRVILGTDGAFNVGISSTEELVELIEEKRKTGIYLTVLGVGTGNLNDAMMEQLANNGNGNYEYIDNEEQVVKVFSLELGKFYSVAKDSKIQISFNENKVDAYRLIGYENRLMSQEDFVNDSTDAGEIGSGQTITALYEVILKDSTANEKLATFDFRYKFPNSDYSQPLSHNIQSEIQNMDEASSNMKFAASITGLGLILKNSEYKGTADKAMILELLEGSLNYDPHGFRYQHKNLLSNWDGK
jgi:Ca-activated chloride channel family protein